MLMGATLERPLLGRPAWHPGKPSPSPAGTLLRHPAHQLRAPGARARLETRLA